MGRPASAEIYTTTARGAAILMEEFPAAMERVEASMSVERDGSELNAVNREAVSGFYRVEDHDLYRCIGLALDYARASDRDFDPTIGPVSRLYRRDPTRPPADGEIEQALEHVGWRGVVMERGVWSLRFRDPEVLLDLGGMVEGYALDVAVRKFVRAGSRAGLLRLGTYAYAWRQPPGSSAWSVELDDPRQAGRPLATVLLASRVLAVAGQGGDSERVLDPHDGRPASSDVRVAVAIADSAADAGAISRAMLVGGSRRAGALLARTNRVEAILVVGGPQGRYVLASASLVGRFEPSQPLADEAQGGIRFLLPPADL